MVRFDLIGFASENEYLNYFFKTLLRTNWTYDYFVEWEKVRKNVAFYVKEISLLNSLSKIPIQDRKRQMRIIFLDNLRPFP